MYYNVTIDYAIIRIYNLSIVNDAPIKFGYHNQITPNYIDIDDTSK